ncbi:hypothetical protein [Rathayibacter sp. AY1A5]|uniref:hypothetical protein n=1 Tax=Rathayibacter sp. AY1A5 TaxID=2080523 RepID=UPI0011B00F6D|nr:hypothetical protein [Rathayibacter sp. AY1A5]
MFGAANSLFSGMAFAGLIIVLLYEMRERERDLSDRMETRRPVLTIKFGDGVGDGEVAQATINRAVHEAERGVDLRLDFTVPLQSLADVALTPAITIEILSKGSVIWDKNQNIGLPINSGAIHNISFVAQFTGLVGAALLAEMNTSTGPRFRARMDYDSVSGARWRTTVEAVVQIAPEDAQFARKVLSGEGIVDKLALTKIASSLKTDILVDTSTWKHSRVPA